MIRMIRIALIILLLPLLLACGDDRDTTDSSETPAAQMGFTFFELGNNTILTKSIRNSLTDKLGRDAIERRSILDLDINYRGFLMDYFPDLAELNRKLNFPPGERVEHNTVKLMYRYARKKDVPFDLVELVFSDYSQKPILFKISFKVDEGNTVEALKEKYGMPESINWQKENGRSMVWKMSGDTLILNLIPNRFGAYDYQIVIYYTENLQQLIEMERKEKEARELQRAKTGKKAF